MIVRKSLRSGDHMMTTQQPSLFLSRVNNAILTAILTCSLILVPLPTRAEVKYVEKGTLAPYTGYLFSPEDEKNARLMAKEMEYFRDLSESMGKLIESDEKVIKVQNERIELYNTQIVNMSKRISETESDNFWRNTLFFVLGAVLTGAITFGVNQVSK
jgi:hypothetical protein